MELIEREGFLKLLETEFQKSIHQQGHCIFISGEAGIGKSALIKAFSRRAEKECKIFTGTCDALFTPRPLAPLYDIDQQLQTALMQNNGELADRTALFSNFFNALKDQVGPLIVVFEDIHWADEATLDFIKFFARRIEQTHCLFLLTYRDNEIDSRHPLRNIFGHLPPDSFAKVHLSPLSAESVNKMAEQRQWNGENIYTISGGNPFFVNEILASYSPGIPENIKDSVLSVYNRQNENVKQAWNMLSVMPTGLELKYLELLDDSHSRAIEDSLATGILILKGKFVFFKHELYRRIIETSLSPLVRISLNTRVLDLFLKNFELNGETERIVHHAKNSNAYDLVVQYAPLAAKSAACMGAHIEAARLYLSAIEYYQGSDKALLTRLYELYAYECYLTNKIREAIIYSGKALNIWKKDNETEKTGNVMWFLSRLWWYEANHDQSELFAVQAVEILDKQPSSRAKGMAYSNMSQLRMLSGKIEEALYWGRKAEEIAIELHDQRILSHVLTNMGTVEMWIPSSRQKGIDHLEKSLSIAKEKDYHEFAARAYTNLCNCGMDIKAYGYTKKILEEGIRYCEEKNLYALMSCLVSCKARLNLETGNLTEALVIAENLIKDENLVPIAKIEVLVMAAKIKMRRGEEGALEMLKEARIKAFGIQELEYIIPVMCALLEFEWITGQQVTDEKDIEQTISMIRQMGNMYKNSEFVFWLSKAGGPDITLPDYYSGYRMKNKKLAAAAAAEWERIGCPYEQALALFEGNEEDKKKALTIVHSFGAEAVFSKWKQSMRASGIKHIPRGMRKTTQSNKALLTNRELDVLGLLKEGLQNKEIASRLFISPKTVDHHISSTLFKLDVNTRVKAVQEAVKLGIIK